MLKNKQNRKKGQKEPREDEVVCYLLGAQPNSPSEI